ncbi:MAG: substrate-binding domain-containing protein [Spirochaetales bacterium]|nr:substrate-binding domain-containing protein [Spirochaetales bacterium]
MLEVFRMFYYYYEWMQEVFEARIQLKNVPKNTDKRLTIGVVIPVLWSIHNLQWMGMNSAARANNVNMVYYLGRELNRPGVGNYSANIIYKLINKDQLDGLIIVTGAIGAVVKAEEQKAFCRSFLPLPVVSVEVPVKGIKSLHIDDSMGIREMVQHMIEVHHYKKIGFIKGPEFSHVAQARFEAYTDTLARFGYKVNPDLIVPNPNLWEPDSSFYDKYWEERQLKAGEDVEAFVSASDGMALRMQTILQSRGIRVPEDIAISGFDDAVESRAAIPPITTVQQPHYEIGKKAVELLVMHIRRGGVSEQTFIKPNPVIRQSCGCESRIITGMSRMTMNWEAISNHGLFFFTSGRLGERHFESVFNSRAQTIRDAVTNHFKNVPIPDLDWTRIEGLVDTVRDAIVENAADKFLSAIRGIFSRIISGGGDSDMCHDVISVLQKNFLPLARDPVIILRVEVLMQQGCAVIGDIMAGETAKHDYERDHNGLEVFNISQDLATTFKLAPLFDILANRLPSLGITSCFIVLYDDPADVFKGARLMLAYDENGRKNLGEGGLPFPTNHFLPGDFLKRNRLFELLVEPLYFNQDQIGYALFEPTRREGTLYEMLRIQLSSSLQGALLLKTVERNSREIEETNHELNEAYKALNENQHSLEKRAVKTKNLVTDMVANIKTISSLATTHGDEVTRLKISGQDNARKAVGLEKEVAGISEILGKAKQLIEMIKDISDTVDLVALNASIEAAHAGEFGKGFSVIAGEIRKLSESTRRNIDNITAFLVRINEGVDGFIKLNREFHTAYAGMNDHIGKVTDFLSDLLIRLDEIEVSSRSILEVMEKNRETVL